MKQTHGMNFGKKYQQFSAACGVLAAVAGFGVLIGWIFGVERLTDFTLDGITMKANAALLLGLSGAALLLLLPREIGTPRLLAGRAIAIFVSLIGLLTLSQHLIGWDLGIDQILAAEPPGAAATMSPGRMGPPASTCYTLTGIALLLLNRKERRAVLASQLMMLVVAAVTLLNLTGNIYGAQQLFAIAMYTGISRQTALLLFILAIGIVSSRYDRGLMSVFSAEDPGGVTLRRLVIPSIAFPIVFGRLCIYGIEAGWFNIAFGTALFSVALGVAIVMVLWWNSRALNALSSRRREAEGERERLLESERHARMEVERAARLKDEFLATLSHELRTPLNAIVGWVHLLQSNGLDPATVQKGMEVIDRNARIQSELISDLLDMSRITSGKMRLEITAVDLRAVMDAALEAVRLMADQKGVQLITRFDAMDSSIQGDAARLQQIVWNLLSNAVKFTPAGGTVTLSLMRLPTTMQIEVADTGQGIEPEFLPFVFERFRQADASITRKKGGLGLGLTIVKELVDLHGGQISIHSDGRGKGVRCTVELPVASAPVTQEKPGSHLPDAVSANNFSVEVPQLAGLTVLVLEDEADTRDIIMRVLSEWGAVSMGAGTAEEATEILAHNPVDLILSDIGLPLTSGYEWMQELRMKGVMLPAIALTAYARTEDRDRALRAGFNEHLVKPIEPAELLAAIGKLTGGKTRTEKLVS